MNGGREGGRREAVSALLRSYAGDLRGWASRLAAGYVVAASMLLGGILALFAAIAVGITALFRFLERHYGMEIAYAAIGGGLLVLALLLLLIGWLMLRRRPSPLPRPRRQVQAAKQALVSPAVSGAIRRLNAAKAVSADPMTRVLAGAAVALLVGWVAATRLQSWSRGERTRR